MNSEYPYYPPHYTEKKTNKEQGDTFDPRHSLLLVEPKELGHLFKRSTFRVEHDICFRDRSQSESTAVDSAQISNRTSAIQSHHVNLSALSWFKQNYTELSNSETQKLSLYGDNNENHPLLNHTDRYTYYHPDTGCIRGKTLLDLKLPGTPLEALLKKENYWIDVTSPFLDEMKAISKLFHIHPLTTEDIMSHEVREKCDVFRNYLFICYRAFLYDNQQLKPITFYNIVTKHNLLTFHFGNVPHVCHVQQRVDQLQEYIELVPDWINYAVLDEITDSFAPIIQQIESEVDAIDDLIVLYKTDQSDMILRIGNCRKKVIQMVRLLATKVEVLRGLMKRLDERTKESSPELYQQLEEDDELGRIHPDVTLYLGDVQDHILTMLQNLNHYSKVLDRSESNYLARLSIELTQTSNLTNQVIGRLTIFATVLLPMNLVTGLWGMNVKVPGKDYDNLVYFSWIVLSLVAFAILSLSLAKKFRII
ncbi:cora-domain-containing protein [Backusella circina FSU 941]|nr:cora-domain-containing protein [Backusella circina FSU 941]